MTGGLVFAFGLVGLGDRLKGGRLQELVAVFDWAEAKVCRAGLILGHDGDAGAGRLKLDVDIDWARYR